jgi:hypothetical protein
MKRPIGATLLAVALSLPLAAAEPPPSWDRLKSLVGSWQGTVEGKPARLAYALISNGTALVETSETHDASQMVTVYHPDGTSLLMTHYCSAGNQSRMRAERLEGDRIAFALVDSSNVSSLAEHRMTGLVLTFRDPDHLTQEWTEKGGTEEQTGRFEFTRKR